MLFVFTIVTVLIGLSIYFFFRAENLQRSLNQMKRENAKAQKKHKGLQEALALIAMKNEDFLKYRAERVRSEDNENTSVNVMMPLINNYAHIHNECLKGKGYLKAACKKCFDTYDKKAFNEFLEFLNAQEKSVQRFWNNDNLNGYISLMEALMLKFESPIDK